MRPIRLAAVVVAITSLVGVSACSSTASTVSTFDGLTAGQRVYDTTGSSLDPSATQRIERQLDDLKSETGADVVAYVRELDADSDDTLDQVEQLQQAWVSAASIPESTAGAILINREPGNADEARAGVFVGSTFDDGNVPGDEQEAIVEDALIPPLRDGDVEGSLTAGIDRLSSSIRFGPPVTALDRVADGPGSTWLPWTGLAVVLVGAAAALRIYRRRPRASVPASSPSTLADTAAGFRPSRPDHTTDPALATALVHRTAQASALPATVLALAAAGAVRLETLPGTSKRSKGTVGIRLLDHGRVKGDVQSAVWDVLGHHAENGLVDGDALTKAAQKTAAKDVVEGWLDSHGWIQHGTARTRWTFVGLGLLGAAVMIGAAIVASSGAPIMLVAAIPGAVLMLAGIIGAAGYPRFTSAGLDAARPWEAYRDELKHAGKHPEIELDLDAALPDIVALGLGSTFATRLEEATDRHGESTLRAFAGHANVHATDPTLVNWAIFSSTFAATSSSTATVSSAGVAGGGGAAGST